MTSSLVNVMTSRNRVAMGCQPRPRRNALEMRLEAFTSSQLQIYSEDIAGARSRLQMIWSAIFEGIISFLESFE